MIKRKSLISAPAVLNTSDAAMWITGWNEAVDALEAEQEKAVEPHGWMIDGSSEVMSRGHAQAVQTEHQAMGGTAVAYPIYTHPAPPASDHVPETAFGNTERAELIARLIRKADAWDYLQPGATRLNACRQAADMLKADAREIEATERQVEILSDELSKCSKAQQALSLELLERLSKTLTNLGYSTPEGGMEHFGAQIESQLYNLCRGVDSILAQQVVVPTGWALVPIEPTPAILDAMSSSGWKTACYKAMLAAAQGVKLVTKKDSKTDWSAA